jgi:hypothetical protein
LWENLGKSGYWLLLLTAGGFVLAWNHENSSTVASTQTQPPDSRHNRENDGSLTRAAGQQRSVQQQTSKVETDI